MAAKSNKRVKHRVLRISSTFRLEEVSVWEQRTVGKSRLEQAKEVNTRVIGK